MHIFICDDDRIFANKFAELVKEELHKHQIDTDIHTFLSASALTDAFQKKQPCDILFLDIDMPETNGIDLAVSLKAYEIKPYLCFHCRKPCISDLQGKSFLVYPQTFLRIRAAGGYYCFACRYAHSFAGNYYFKLCAFHLHPSPTQHLLRGMPEQNPAHSLRKSGTEYFHSLYAFFLGKGAFALWFS